MFEDARATAVSADVDESWGATDRSGEGTGERDLIVVSNRQPYRHTYDSGELTVDRPAGGLTAGLDPALQRVGGTWVAWGDGDGDPEAVDGDDRVAVPPESPAYTLRRVWLAEEEVDGYYRGFANQVLWPVCHSAVDHVRCEPGFWDRYRAVNDRFAEAALEEAGPESIVWLQDYHFALAPRAIRAGLPPEAFLTQFWHVPWPDWETFRACPHAEALIRGLLGNDLLGFHVPRYRRNFLGCVEAAVAGARIDWEAGRVRHPEGVTLVETSPMGVEADEIGRRAASSAADAFWDDFADAHGLEDVTVAVGVDRLDYTKGIVERLRALEHLLETRPGWRGELTFVQSASESRSAIPAYREVQGAIEEAVERVNRRFGTDDWQPVIYTTEWLSRDELAGLYRGADAAIVSPARDGMNLVAQEYVAAQVEGDGVLLLSELAGVHDVLGEHAVSVTPADVAGLADGIAEALAMTPAERRRRMAAMRRWVTENDLASWVDGFLGRAEEARRRARPDAGLVSGVTR